MQKSLCVLLMLFLSCAALRAQNQKPDAPDRAELLRQAARCRQLLKTTLVDFYLPACVDSDNGGYKESLKDSQFVLTGEKFLTLQARQLWFFSTLAENGIEKQRSLAAAKSGFDFLQRHMLDHENGGYYSKVSDAGKPTDARKHVYLNSFALFGLVAYYQASHDSSALAAAEKLFQVLEEKAGDKNFGGYVEFFEPNWSDIKDAKSAGYVGALGTKTYNTHLHMLESLTALYHVWPNPMVRQRVRDLLLVNTSAVHSRIANNNPDAYHRDWSIVDEQRNLRASYGHDVECIWLVMDAARTMDVSSAILSNWASGLAESCLTLGYDAQHGGFYSSGPLTKPADDLKKIWWVQNEALLGMLQMYRLTGDSKYYRAFAQTLDFSEKFQVAKEGGWWATRNPDGSATGDTQRSSMWQGAYHAGRSLLYSAKWLEAMAR